MIRALILLLALALAVGLPGRPATAQDEITDPEALTAVEFDGGLLFTVRGSSELPAERRARMIVERLVQAADVSRSPVVSVETRKGEFGTEIWADGVMVTTVAAIDAVAEEMDLDTLIKLRMARIERAIADYRLARTGKARLRSAIEVLVWSGGFAVFCGALLFARRRLPGLIERVLHRQLGKREDAASRMIQAEAIGALVWFFLNLALVALLFLGLYYYLSFVLLAFVETRTVARLLLTYVTDPILTILRGFLGFIPNLIMLTIIAWIAAWAIRGIRVYFDALKAGTFRLRGFERHWITPTFNILRVGVILIALVFAYPYIPGSDSRAFQGLTIIIGAMLSLGSNSVISNLLSGFFVIYRRSTNIGDRIRIGEHTGDVVEIKLMETLLKSVKNEMISIPNAQMLNSEVINYTRHVDKQGLLIHTVVGIGYEEPPEKVEAMLIEAARRTEGLKQRPEPFVLWTALGDFAINYQINAYSSHGGQIPRIVSDLHRNIMAVFTENRVQIMTPNYRADPSDPKVPPEEPWDGVLAPRPGATVEPLGKAV